MLNPSNPLPPRLFTKHPTQQTGQLLPGSGPRCRAWPQAARTLSRAISSAPSQIPPWVSVWQQFVLPDHLAEWGG